MKQLRKVCKSLRRIQAGNKKDQSEITEDFIVGVIEEAGLDLESVDFGADQLVVGYKVELEHGTVNSDTNVTDDDPVMTLKIAWAHLLESPTYYVDLKKMESK